MIKPNSISRSHQRVGFTLVEMVASMAILSILLLACGSIIAMASYATGGASTNNRSQQQTADAAAQVEEDLNVALNFTQRTATATTFTVPDRLSTGSPQVVTYNWTGHAGDPLLRQFNGGTATSILNGVQNFSMLFNPRLMGPAATPTEQVLFSHDAAVGALTNNKLDDKNWGSQYFIPTLPVGTSSYTLTRIRLMLKSGSALSAALNVKLVSPDVLFRPTGTTIAQTTVYESALSTSYEWIDIPFTGLSNQNPLQGLCIVLAAATGSADEGSVQVDQSLLPVTLQGYWSSTSNAGSTWTIGLSITCARCYVFGTVP